MTVQLNKLIAAARLVGRLEADAARMIDATSPQYRELEAARVKLAEERAKVEAALAAGGQ